MGPWFFIEFLFKKMLKQAFRSLTILYVTFRLEKKYLFITLVCNKFWWYERRSNKTYLPLPSHQESQEQIEVSNLVTPKWPGWQTTGPHVSELFVMYVY